MKDVMECRGHPGNFWVHGTQGCCKVCGGKDGWAAPRPSEPTDVDDTLAERGNRYGDFTDHARIAEALHGILVGDTPAGKFNTSWGTMKPFQRQALRVIVDKIARILNGDPNYIDNWHDLQGYAKLVEDRLAK